MPRTTHRKRRPQPLALPGMLGRVLSAAGNAWNDTQVTTPVAQQWIEQQDPYARAGLRGLQGLANAAVGGMGAGFAGFQQGVTEIPGVLAYQSPIQGPMGLPPAPNPFAALIPNQQSAERLGRDLGGMTEQIGTGAYDFAPHAMARPEQIAKPIADMLNKGQPEAAPTQFPTEPIPTMRVHPEGEPVQTPPANPFADIPVETQPKAQTPEVAPSPGSDAVAPEAVVPPTATQAPGSEPAAVQTETTTQVPAPGVTSEPVTPGAVGSGVGEPASEPGPTTASGSAGVRASPHMPPDVEDATSPVPQTYRDAARMTGADPSLHWFLDADGNKPVYAWSTADAAEHVGSNGMSVLANYPKVEGNGLTAWYKPGEEARAQALVDGYNPVESAKPWGEPFDENYHRQAGDLLGYDPAKVDEYIEARKAATPETVQPAQAADLAEGQADLNRGELNANMSAPGGNRCPGTGDRCPGTGFAPARRPGRDHARRQQGQPQPGRYAPGPGQPRA